MSLSPRTILSAILLSCAATFAAAQEGSVHVRFFHTECRECEVVRRHLDGLGARYGSRLVVHDLDYMNPSNYLLMAQLEQALGVGENEPVAVYVGTNHLYGITRIEAGLERLIAAGIAAGGVPLWIPGGAGETNAPDAHAAQADTVVERFRGFSCAVIIGAGLLDGINPCAFATLILFVTLLSCYRSNARDILVTSLVFSAAVFVTYVALGAGLLVALKSLAGFRTAGLVLRWGIVALCVVLAMLSLRDALKARQPGAVHDFTLGLPPTWRARISRLLSNYVGRRRWLAGVFGVGVVVSLLESVCTGQVYIPTMAYVIQIAGRRLAALGWLLLYNVCFIAPIIVLALLVATGVRSQRLLELQRRHAFSARIVMACLFAALAAVLALA
ncbi:hypothetical protein GX586_11545 [bacterium]|nr:hypothetical protein [bacterium]